MILVFCKYYNDLDQIVPVVYELARHGDQEIEMVLLDPAYDLESDFRINFLKKNFSIKVTYYHKDPCAGTIKPFVLMRFIYGSAGIFVMNTLVKLSHFGGKKFHKKSEEKIRRLPGKFIKKWYGKDYARLFFSHRNPDVIISDNRPRPVRLYEVAKEIGIPVVGLPHGLNTSIDQSNSMQNVEGEKSNNKKQFQHDLFHMFSVQFDQEKNRLVELGTPPDKVRVMGSSRYCTDWHQIYKTITPAPIITDVEPGKRRLRVVFMDHSSKYRMVAEEIVRNIKAVLELDFVDFVLKPSTGKMNTKVKPDADFATLELLDICRLASDEHSYNLIDWADVVICTHSSILIEIMVQGKTFLYPKHFTELTGLYEQYNACWQVNSQEELVDALRKAYETPSFRPYTQKAVDAVCEVMILGHKPNRKVLEDHRDAILEVGKILSRNSAG